MLGVLVAPLHYKLLTSSCNASTLEWQQTLKWTIKELELHCQFNIGESGDIFISWNLYLFVMCFREGLKKKYRNFHTFADPPPPKVWKIIFYFFFNSRPLLEIFRCEASLLVGVSDVRNEQLQK